MSVDSEGLRAGDKGQNLLGKRNDNAARQGQEAVGTLGRVVALEGEAHLDDAPAQQDQAHGPDQAEDEQSPQDFKGGAIWNVVSDIHGALQAIGYALLVLFFVVGVVKTCGSFVEVKKPEHPSRHTAA